MLSNQSAHQASKRAREKEKPREYGTNKHANTHSHIPCVWSKQLREKGARFEWSFTTKSGFASIKKVSFPAMLKNFTFYIFGMAYLAAL